MNQQQPDYSEAWRQYYAAHAAYAAQGHQAASPYSSAAGAPSTAAAATDPHAAAWAAYYASQQQHQQQYGYQAPPPSHPHAAPYNPSAATGAPLSYNAVPPPASLTGAGGHQYQQHGRGHGLYGRQQQQQPAYLSAAPAPRPPASTAMSRSAAAAAGRAAVAAAIRPSGTPGAPAPASGRAAPSPSQQQQQPWPPSLRSYVERAFASSASSAAEPSARAALAAALKATIASSQSRGDLWTRDWDREPLPSSGPTPSEQPQQLRRAFYPTYAHQQHAQQERQQQQQQQQRHQYQQQQHPSTAAMLAAAKSEAIRRAAELSSSSTTASTTLPLPPPLPPPPGGWLPTSFGRASAAATGKAPPSTKRGRSIFAGGGEEGDGDGAEEEQGDDFIPLGAAGGRGRGRGARGRGRGLSVLGGAVSKSLAVAGRGRGGKAAAAKAAAAPKAGKKGHKRGRGLWGAASDDEMEHDEGDEEEEEDLDPEERARRARRAGRFGSGAAEGVVVRKASKTRAGGREDDSSSCGVGIVAGRRRAALEAMSAASGAGAGGGPGSGGDLEAAWDGLVVRGTSTKLDKSYFRLTAPPDPSTVRPAPVLSSALARLVSLVATRKENYFYAGDQLKGMRQDCTVQRLRGELAAAVYESHARAALEYGDAAEYNQCQAQLEILHSELLREMKAKQGKGERGAEKTTTPSSQTAAPAPWPFDVRVIDEFSAYRVLYQAAYGMSSAGERMALMRTLSRLADEGDGGGGATGESKKQRARGERGPAVEHALAVRRAIADRDACSFFRLYSTAPRLGRLLMDVAAPAMRFYALNAFVRAERPTAPVPMLARVLGFCRSADGSSRTGGSGGGNERGKGDATKTIQAPGILPGCSSVRCPGACSPADDEEEGCAAAAAWLAAHGAVLIPDVPPPSSAAPAATADATAAPVGPSRLAVDCKASLDRLAVPEDADAVAHGDANLAIDDFLSRAMMG